MEEENNKHGEMICLCQAAGWNHSMHSQINKRKIGVCVLTEADEPGCNVFFQALQKDDRDSWR